MFPFGFLFFFLMSFTSSAFFSLFSGLLWLLLLLLLCVISHVSHALCISRYLMPLFTLFSLSPSLGRVLFSARVLQLYSIYSKSNGFFCLPSLHSPHSVFYFILFQLSVYFCLCACVCVQSLKAISMVVSFLANILYAVVGVSFGGSNSHSSLIECFYYAK